MLRTEMLAELREMVGDTVAPYFWSDSILLEYLSEGQDVFCEKSGFFTDRSSFPITTELGKKNYPLSDRIIEVMEVWDGPRRLQRYTQLSVPGIQSLTTSNMPPLNWQTDAETHTLTLYELPTAGIVLNLSVWRYAKKALNNRSLNTEEPPVLAYDAEPEIPPRFHRAGLEYGAYKAFGYHDWEKQDPVKAADHLQGFDRYCADGARAFRRITGDEVRVAPSAIYSFT